VVEGLIEPGDAAAANIMDSEGLFRSGLVGSTVVFVVDLVIARELYVFLRTVSTDLSLLPA
jgi:hypothetical protein